MSRRSSQRTSPWETHRAEHYLAALYELEEEGLRPTQARVARRLGIGRAAVSEQVAKLAGQGLVAIEDRRPVLATRGRAIGEQVIRRHRLAERFLADVMGIAWHLVRLEARTFQEGITESIDRAIVELLGDPRTCPHGNPIPGAGRPPQEDLAALSVLPVGAHAELVRITSDAELDESVLVYLSDHALVPGRRVEIVGRSPDGTMTVRGAERRASLGLQVTDNLWARVLPSDPPGT